MRKKNTKKKNTHPLCHVFVCAPCLYQTPTTPLSRGTLFPPFLPPPPPPPRRKNKPTPLKLSAEFFAPLPFERPPFCLFVHRFLRDARGGLHREPSLTQHRSFWKKKTKNSPLCFCSP